MSVLHRMIAIIGLVAGALSGWMAFNFVFMDEIFHEGMELSGSAKAIQSEFQNHFHELTTYPRYSLSELETQGILSKEAVDDLRMYHAHYKPFGPDTPKDALVLHLRGDFLNLYTLDFTKADLTSQPAFETPR